MPNWTYNTLTIHGDKKEIDRFVDLVRYIDDDGEQRYNILSTILPTPVELTNTVSGWHGDEDKQRELEQRQQANLEKYGHKDWYDWNHANWGCKWSDSETNVTPPSADGEVAYVTFHTPWAPPLNGFARIAHLFPSLTFVLSYTEEGNFFVGATAFKDNVVEVVDGNEKCADDLFEEGKYDEGYETLDHERLKCAGIAHRRILGIHDDEHALN